MFTLSLTCPSSPAPPRRLLLIIGLVLWVLLPLATSSVAAADSAAPLFYSIHGNKVVAHRAAGAPRTIATVCNDRPVLAAARGGDDMLLVLCQNALQRIALRTGQVSLVGQLHASAQAGTLVAAPDRSQIAYAIYVEDATTEFGTATIVGTYDVQRGAAGAIREFGQHVEVVGFTADRTHLYVVPRGQDPAFSQVQLLRIADGKITKRLPVQGYGDVDVFSDGHTIVATDFQTDAQGRSQWTFKVYNAATGARQPRVLGLPLVLDVPATPSWVLSPTGATIYALLHDGDPLEPSSARGVWSIDLQAGDWWPVASPTDADDRLEAISPDGTWLLTRNERTDEAGLWNTTTNQRTALRLPPDAVFAGWL